MSIDFSNKSIYWWQDIVHTNAVSKGWWEQQSLTNLETLATKLSLIHSEVSEALEEARTGNIEVWFNVEKSINGIPKPEGVMVELADTIIRCMDLAAALEEQGLSSITLTQALGYKHEYNLNRPVMHGGKKF